MKTQLAIFLFISALHACNTISIEKKIIGEWKMLTVYDASIDVSSKHNPANERWIMFNPDGVFESGGKPFGPNRGAWEIDSKKSILILHSDADNDDSAWHLTIEKDRMYWIGIGDERKAGYKLVYQRS